MKKLISTSCFILFATLSFSQKDRKADCHDCVDGLKAACFNTYGFSSENEFQSFLSTYFNMTDEQRLSYRNSNSTSAGLKAVIDAIPIGFTGSHSTEEDRQEYKRLEELFKQNQSVFSSDIVKIYTKLVDANALKAYETCITACYRSAGGVNALAYNIDGDTNDEFIVSVNWRPTNALTTSKVSSFQSTNLMLKNGANIYNGADFKAFTPLTQAFKRIDSSKPASINIAFVGLGEPIAISLDGEDKLARYLPIGTIIASVLNYQQFTGQGFDDKKSIWAPADGRSVSNSDFGKNINPNVPDLRGQFLRGLNQFYSPGEPSTIVNKAGQTDRFLNNQYSYQSEAIGKHSHPITDKEHSHSYSRGGTIDSWGGRVVPSGQSGGMDHINDPLGSSKSFTGIINTENNTGLETRPNNIAVYYYIKIN